MKNMLLFTALLVASLSCKKSVDEKLADTNNQTLTMGKNSVLQSRFLVANVSDSVTLTVDLKPFTICYGYENGEQAKPCNIFVDFNLTLSQPVDSYVKVELERFNLVQELKDKSDSTGTDAVSEVQPQRVVATIAPNTTHCLFKSQIMNLNNRTVPSEDFRIVSVSLVSTRD